MDTQTLELVCFVELRYRHITEDFLTSAWSKILIEDKLRILGQFLADNPDVRSDFLLIKSHIPRPRSIETRVRHATEGRFSK